MGAVVVVGLALTACSNDGGPASGTGEVPRYLAVSTSTTAADRTVLRSVLEAALDQGKAIQVRPTADWRRVLVAGLHRRMIDGEGAREVLRTAYRELPDSSFTGDFASDMAFQMYFHQYLPPEMQELSKQRLDRGWKAGPGFGGLPSSVLLDMATRSADERIRAELDARIGRAGGECASAAPTDAAAAGEELALADSAPSLQSCRNGLFEVFNARVQADLREPEAVQLIELTRLYLGFPEMFAARTRSTLRTAAVRLATTLRDPGPYYQGLPTGLSELVSLHRALIVLDPSYRPPDHIVRAIAGVLAVKGRASDQVYPSGLTGNFLHRLAAERLGLPVVAGEDYFRNTELLASDFSGATLQYIRHRLSGDPENACAEAKVHLDRLVGLGKDPARTSAELVWAVLDVEVAESCHFPSADVLRDRLQPYVATGAPHDITRIWLARELGMVTVEPLVAPDRLAEAPDNLGLDIGAQVLGHVRLKEFAEGSQDRMLDLLIDDKTG